MQEVGTNESSPRSKFAQELALKKTAPEDEAYLLANMPTYKRQQVQIHLSDAETVAMTRSLADTECVTNQLLREIYGITSNEQKPFMTEFSVCLIEFEALWKTIGIHALLKTIEQHVIHFGYLKMDLVRHIAESFRQMGSGENYTTDISERQHLANVKEAYQSSNNVNYIRQILKQND
jgi:hypothetical protein